MKYIILFVCCFLTAQESYSQSASSFYKKADSLSKAKDYKNAAIAISEGIRLEKNAARIDKYNYWRCAILWSLAGNADSAFHYLSFLEKSDKITVREAKKIENEEKLNFIKSDKRWQPVVNSIINNAVISYKKLSESIRAGKRMSMTWDKYEIAVAWAIEKNTDSVLFYLNSIINTDYNKYVAFEEISQEKTFSYLYNDPRWVALLNEVKKNTTPFTCAHKPRGANIPIIATIDAASKFIKADGKGSYRDDEDMVFSNIMTAYNLALSGMYPLDWSEASSRFIAINLNKPIKKSGSVKQGIIIDHFTILHSFYKIDTAIKLDLIYNFTEIPIGTTTESPRTDFEFHIKGKSHMLKFGYWGLGHCGEAYAHGGKVNGAGTTMVKITRHTATSFTIEAPKGSIGRLWDISNRTKPVDKGLFESGFIVHLNTQ